MEMGKSVKLEVILDSKRHFTRHIKEASVNTAKVAMADGRLMLNIGGPSTAKRRLLLMVGESHLLYAVLAWARRADKFKVNRKEMEKA